MPIGTLVTKSAKLVFFLLIAVVPEAECAESAGDPEGAPEGADPGGSGGPGRTLHGGIAEVAVTVEEQLGGASVARVVAEAAVAAKVEDEIEMWRWGMQERPLVIGREEEAVWLGRVRSTSPDASHRPRDSPAQGAHRGS